MFDISFEVGGRKVNPKSMKDALAKAVLESATESIKKKVKSIRCHEHHSGAKIKVKGKSLDKLSMEVSGCCDVLIEKVKKKLH